jgi:hypothetical protein
LHDDVQLAGGELPNHLLHSSPDHDARSANHVAAKPDLEPNGDPDLHGNLRFDTTCMPEQLRPAISLAVKSQAGLRLAGPSSTLIGTIDRARYAVMM